MRESQFIWGRGFSNFYLFTSQHIICNLLSYSLKNVYFINLRLRFDSLAEICKSLCFIQSWKPLRGKFEYIIIWFIWQYSWSSVKITSRDNLHVLPTNFWILKIQPGVLITSLNLIMRTCHYFDSWLRHCISWCISSPE